MAAPFCLQRGLHRTNQEPYMSSYRNLAGSMLLGLAAAGIAHAQAPAPAAANTDPHLWLEEVLGDKPLAWVKQHNAVTVKELAGVGLYCPV